MAERLIPETIRIPEADSEDLEKYIEQRLKRIYGTGTYISDFYRSSQGSISVNIGNSFPKDVTDCRDNQEQTIKFIAVDDIAELEAESVDSGYEMKLKTRDEVSQGLATEKKRLRENLSQAMAQATYEKIARTPAVENQLNPIKQILRWTRKYHPVKFSEIKKAQAKEDGKTYKYVKTLQNLGFIRFDGEYLYSAEPLDKYDLGEISTQEFNEKILGEVVERGYKELSEKLGLNILRHLPKFANSYYFDAVERNDPDLHLDLHAIRNNLKELYGYSAVEHEFVLEDKMDQLVSLEILSSDEDDDLYYADQDTFFDVSQLAMA
ncbi:hypothetical protein [Halocalculus aciditolerans]|uniref:Uncharacterized protein n=1 Tax=Halocalculus aciditolerans TaxID=1383812 RepID=A0A830FHX6_9EURY|nr:hypothetical protein [Halocalculus aciditolerans]GGL57713.1 hypothetical protein GCM10009039_14870 [Halocalculus aciditolerans]